MNRLAFALLTLPFLIASTGAEPKSSSPVKITEQAEGFLFQEGPSKILFYQLAPKSLNGKYERSNYIHPLYDLDGNVLTEDFPQDHYHHHGIFWAWHQVFVNGKRVGDQWANEDSIWDVQDSEVLPAKKGEAAVRVRLHWKSPRWLDAHGEQKPFAEEITTVRVHPAEDDIRKIDFSIELKALEDDVKIGGSEDVKGYGGFSTRIRLPKDIRFLGHNGPVTPQETSVKAGPWLDFSGSYGSKPGSGLAILTHPSVPDFPQPWILRAAHSMQNPAYPGNKPIRLPTDKPLTLRYRLVIHRGELTRDRLDQLQSAYEREP